MNKMKQILKQKRKKQREIKRNLAKTFDPLKSMVKDFSNFSPRFRFQTVSIQCGPETSRDGPLRDKTGTQKIRKKIL